MSPRRLISALAATALVGASVALTAPVASAATFDVTSGADDALAPAPDTLRGAVEAANASPGPDTITIQPGLTITLEDIITINDDVTIVSSGGTTVTTTDGSFPVFNGDFDGAELFALEGFTVDGIIETGGSRVVSLTGMTVTGPADDVHEFNALAQVIIDTSNFSGASAELFRDDDCSGTVSSIRQSVIVPGNLPWLIEDCATEVVDSTFHDAPGTALEVDIAATEAFTVTGSTFEANGQGLSVRGAGSVLIADSVFAGNGATSSEGGALHLEEVEGEARIQRSVFEGNTSVDGGAISLGQAEGGVIIEDSTFTGNSATGMGGAINGEETESLITILRSEFEGNAAVAGGALGFDELEGPIRIEDTTFRGNVADEHGGAIFVGALEGEDLPAGLESLMTVLRSTFTQNAAAYGTSIWIWYADVVEEAPAVLLISLSTFDETEVAPSTGGAVEDGAGALIAGFEESGGTEDAPLRVIIDNSTLVGGGIAFLDLSQMVELSLQSTVIDSGPHDAVAIAYDYNLALTVNGAGAVATQPGPWLAGSGVTTATRAAIALAPLADNGGLTPTRLPQPESVLVDGNPLDAPLPATDQRGFARLQGAHLDVGAVELQLGTVTLTESQTVVEGASAQLTLTATGPSDWPIVAQVALVDGTAIAGADYVAPAPITVTWPLGVTGAQTVQVDTIARAGTQGDRAFDAVLSSASGALVGTPSTATITITDADEPVVTPEPSEPAASTPASPGGLPNTGVESPWAWLIAAAFLVACGALAARRGRMTGRR